MKQYILTLSFTLFYIPSFAADPFSDIQRDINSLRNSIVQMDRSTSGIQRSTPQLDRDQPRPPKAPPQETKKIKLSTDKVIDENNIHLIPGNGNGDYSDNASEAREYKRNWKNKRFVFIGKVNRSNGFDIDLDHITGCESVTRGIKTGTPIAVSAILESSSRGAREALITVRDCKANILSEPYSSDEIKDIRIGELKNTIKTAETYGCFYELRTDKNKKTTVGALSADDSGIVINVNGSDVLFKGVFGKNESFSGKFSNFTLKIPHSNNTSLNFSSPTGYKLSIPVTGHCGW